MERIEPSVIVSWRWRREARSAPLEPSTSSAFVTSPEALIERMLYRPLNLIAFNHVAFGINQPLPLLPKIRRSGTLANDASENFIAGPERRTAGFKRGAHCKAWHSPTARMSILPRPFAQLCNFMGAGYLFGFFVAHASTRPLC
jgi:hypothetical protein